MARSVNKVILIGRIGKDPDYKLLPGGTQICNISVATSETWKDKSTGEKQEAVSWHNAVAFNKLAQVLVDYAKKGTMIYIEGHIKYEKYTDKNSVDRTITKIFIHEIRILGEGKSADTKTSAKNNDDFATSADSDDDFFDESELPA